MKSHCPYCGFTITVINPDPDEESRRLARREIDHMEAAHPEIIAERLTRIGEVPEPKRPMTNSIPVINEQTGEKGLLALEPPESRFNYMITVNDAGHELGYWQAFEWQRDGWVELADGPAEASE